MNREDASGVTSGFQSVIRSVCSWLSVDRPISGIRTVVLPSRCMEDTTRTAPNRVDAITDLLELF